MWINVSVQVTRWRKESNPIHSDIQTDSQTDTQTDRQTDRQTEWQTDRQTEWQTERQTHRQSDRYTDIHTDRVTDRETDTQTDRQTHRHRQITNSFSIGWCCGVSAWSRSRRDQPRCNTNNSSQLVSNKHKIHLVTVIYFY